MATKCSSRFRPSARRARSAGRPKRRVHSTFLATLVVAVAALGFAASPGLADTGSVYVDGHTNVGAGHDFFGPGLAGAENVGLGYSVMPALTTGSDNVAAGIDALAQTTSGYQNTATGGAALRSTTTGHGTSMRWTATGLQRRMPMTLATTPSTRPAASAFSSSSGCSVRTIARPPRTAAIWNARASSRST